MVFCHLSEEIVYPCQLSVKKRSIWISIKLNISYTALIFRSDMFQGKGSSNIYNKSEYLFYMVLGSKSNKKWETEVGNTLFYTDLASHKDMHS